MSSLTGHAQITATAVRELASEWRVNPVVAGLSEADLVVATVGRDILDVLIIGHWADFGQKHHFMRQFDQQSPYDAYESAVEWIRTNALQSARDFAPGIRLMSPRGVSHERYRQVGGAVYFSGISWQPLGNAVHALEDSFASGHATRGPALNAKVPGLIEHIKRYAGAEKEGHEHGDAAWKNEQGGLTQSGRFAVEAVKNLLRIVISTAQASNSPNALVGWQNFRDRWLRASSKLSKSNDRVFELIDQHYTGLRVGATNVKTLNMNEEGLAKALLKEDSQTTLAVFVRLDEQYNSDADDVAELYVNLVQSRGGAALSSLKGNRPLIQRLIKVMDEGWTSSGEQKCIKFLKSLL